MYLICKIRIFLVLTDTDWPDTDDSPLLVVAEFAGEFTLTRTTDCGTRVHKYVNFLQLICWSFKRNGGSQSTTKSRFY